MKRSNRLKRSAMRRGKKKKPKPTAFTLWLDAKVLTSKLAHERARDQKICQHPDCKTPTALWDTHHVVEAQEVERLGFPRWDTRNVLRLCLDCHRHHTQHTSLVPLVALTEDNLDYAFAVMGERAFNYLGRHYSGEDPRLAERLRRCQA